MTIHITLPFPPWKLSPNARGNWRSKEKERKAYYLTGYTAALGIKVNDNICKKRISLEIDFYPPSGKNDLDNCLSAIKYGLDGIARALNINDKQFRPITINIPSVDKLNPRVEIRIIAY